MYEAKGERASHIYLMRLRLEDGVLIEVRNDEAPASEDARS